MCQCHYVDMQLHRVIAETKKMTIGDPLDRSVVWSVSLCQSNVQLLKVFVHISSTFKRFSSTFESSGQFNFFCRSVQHGPQNHLAHMNKLIEFCETGVKEVWK